MQPNRTRATRGVKQFIPYVPAASFSKGGSDKELEEVEERARLVIIAPGIRVLETKMDTSPAEDEKPVMEQDTNQEEDEPSTLPVRSPRVRAISRALSTEQDEPMDLSLPKPKRKNTVLPGASCANPDPEESQEVILQEGLITLDSYSAEDDPNAEQKDEHQLHSLKSMSEDLDAWGLPMTQAGRLTTTQKIADSKPVPDAPWEMDRGDANLIPLARVVREIRSQGLPQPGLPKWMVKNRGYSAHILHDGDLVNWAKNDKKFCLTHRNETSVKKWIRVLQEGEILFRGRVVVVWLRSLSDLEAKGQLKNAIAGLTRAIRSVTGEETRLFFGDHLVIPDNNKVLGLRAERHNDLLFRSLRSIRISHNLQKVYFLGMAKYFDEQGLAGHLRRNHRYLQEAGRFMGLGCLHFCANLQRELGFTSY